MRLRRTTAALLISAAFLLGCKSSCLAKSAKVSNEAVAAQLAAPAPKLPREFDHSAYAGLLQKYVHPDQGRVDYRGMSYERDALAKYVKRLGTVSLEIMTPEDRFALLINAYNAMTLLLILENYPVDSIRDLDDPWTDKRWALAGQMVSLDDIEHGLLRPLLRDPRVHFVLNCAAVDCPPLWNEPYTGKHLWSELDEATRRTLNDAKWVNVVDGKVEITPLLSWYGDDFTSEHWKPRADSVIDFVSRYNPRVKPGMPSSFRWYDWSLNDLAN